MIVVITGPVRSGKSTRALHVARDFGAPVTHVMTARVDPADAEMADRIARHRLERGAEQAIELWGSGGDLAAVIAAASPGTTLLVDSIGTWVAGHLLEVEALAERAPATALAHLDAVTEPLFGQLAAARSNVVFVAEETGWGLVPMTAQGRIFRDLLGRMTQRIGRLAARVELVVAGYAIDLRRYGVPVSASGTEN
jgi:adenosylcobinamide kinase/adenosylcobinamide-phosphate guanylyltransferase